MTRRQVHNVRLLIGANAYAVVSHGNNRQTDIRLSPGKSAVQSLREYARDLQAEIDRKREMVAIACEAANILEKDPSK